MFTELPYQITDCTDHQTTELRRAFNIIASQSKSRQEALPNQRFVFFVTIYCIIKNVFFPSHGKK